MPRRPSVAGPVSTDGAVTGASPGYPLLAAALERHLTWARDFAAVGDLESAVDAIRDAHATFTEACGPGSSAAA